MVKSRIMPAAEGRAPNVRLWPRLAAAEVLLAAFETALLGVPLFLWAGWVGAAPLLVRAALPVGLALWIAGLLLTAAALRPVTALALAKRRHEPALAVDVAVAERAMERLPQLSALLRFFSWMALPALIVALAPARPGAVAVGGFGCVMLMLAGAGSAARALILDREFERLRPLLLPNLEGMHSFARLYRGRIICVALATLGFAHATWMGTALATAGVSARALAWLGLVSCPVLLTGSVFWVRSLLRRVYTVENYFDVTLRSPGTRGPARDEPRAVSAFATAQAVPYRLAGYQAFVVMLAGVVAVAVGRRVGAFDVASAGRLLLGLVLAALLGMTYQALILRAMLRPLLAHLGSRHNLASKDIRSNVGARAKLLTLFSVVGGSSAGFVGLFHLAPDGTAGIAAPVLVLGMLLCAGLAIFAAREFMAPLRVLEDRSLEMARGDLVRPVAAPGEADEIGRLAMAFEEMRRSLRDRLRSTESINVDLEREVRRRTLALEERNKELGQALDQLRRAQDDLLRTEKLASMGRLVAGIAHEINNPVNAIINSLGPLEDLMRQARVDTTGSDAASNLAAADEMLSVISRGAARTKNIVQALHNYSRADESATREVSLGRSVDDSLDLLRHRLRHVKIEKDVDAGARINGFPGQIDQVLMNLLTNAAQSMGERGGTIRIGARAEDGVVVVTVADEGPGIPAEILPRIFDPFFTTKEVGEGSGLGLSIVHGIVERHRGRIDVDSVPGRGTTFRLEFPRV